MDNLTLSKSCLTLKRDKVGFILLISVFAILVTSGDYLKAQSPFSANPSKSAGFSESGWKDQILQTINQLQLDMRREITGLVRQFRNDKKPTAVLALIAFSFLYGIIHALGPGHGKGIVMSYMLSEENPSVMKGVLIGSIIAFGEALSAILIVYSIYYFSLGRVRSTFDYSAEKITMVSYGILLCIGLVLLAFRIKKHLPGPGHNTRFDRNQETSSSKKSFLVAASLGIIPCPGVMILIVFMLAMKLPLIGLLLALIMAFGMSITISAFGSIVAISKTGVLGVLSKNRGRMKNLEAFLEIFGAILIVSIAAIFLLA